MEGDPLGKKYGRTQDERLCIFKDFLLVEFFSCKTNAERDTITQLLMDDTKLLELM